MGQRDSCLRVNTYICREILVKVYPLYTRWKSSHLRGAPVGRPAGRSVLQSGDSTNNTSSAELRLADLFVITTYCGSVNKVSFAYKI